jgi:tRNA acetyltransferase TAN1
MTYSYNLLISYGLPSHRFRLARQEIRRILAILGDENPLVKRTIARGIAGVNSVVDSREIIKGLYEIYNQDSAVFRNTVKWIPVDFWMKSDLESMTNCLSLIAKDKIKKGEKWMLVVEKRRYSRYHKADIIKHLADLIDEKVDLKNPDKIVRIEIIGNNAGISVIRPNEIFSIRLAASDTMEPSAQEQH